MYCLRTPTTTPNLPIAMQVLVQNLPRVFLLTPTLITVLDPQQLSLLSFAQTRQCCKNMDKSSPGCQTRTVGTNPHVPTAASLASAKAVVEKAEREQQEAAATKAKNEAAAAAAKTFLTLWPDIEVECKGCGQKYTENGNGGDTCKKAVGGTKYRPNGPHVPTDASFASAKVEAERELEEATAAIEVECEDCGQKYTENGNGGDKCKKAGGTKYHPNGYYMFSDTKKYMCCNNKDKSAPGCKTRAGGQTPGPHVPTAASLASARAAATALQEVSSRGSWWGVQSQSPAAARGNDAPFPMKDAEAIASGSVVLRAHLYPADGKEPDLSSTGEVMSLRVKFASLNREKKALRMLLHKFKWDFIAKHGKAPSSDDRHPVKGKFTRISEVKEEINRIERDFRNDPLFASLPLDMSITEDEFVWEVLPNGVVNASPTPEQEASFARDAIVRSSEPAMQAARAKFDDESFRSRWWRKYINYGSNPREAVDRFVEQMRANEAAVANLGAGTDSTDAAAAATAAAQEAAAKFASSTVGTADTSQIMAAATEAIEEAEAESVKRKVEEKKATQKLKSSASYKDKMEGARQLQQQALDAMKAAATAAKAAADASAAASQPSPGGGAAASGAASAMEAAAVAAALASLPTTTVDKETVTALGDMLTSATDASSKKAAVLTLSALTSTCDDNAEQVASDPKTVNAIVSLSVAAAGKAGKTADELLDDTAIQLHAATAMANMSEEAGGSETMANVLLKDDATAAAILGAALPSATDTPVSAEEENKAFRARVESATSSVDDSEQLMQQLQRKGLEVETVNLVKNLAESTADDSPEMAERLLASSGEALVGFVRDNNVQAIGPATQTLKVLMATAAPTSPALKKTKNAIVKALKHVEEHFSVHNPDAAARLRMLAPPNDLIELIDARIAILLKVRDAKMERDAAAASAIAEEHDQQIKALQTTVAVLQQRCRDLEVQIGGALANADALRDESKRENEALRAKFEDAKKDAAAEATLVNNIKEGASGDRLAELQMQLQATQQKQNEMDQRLQRVEFMVDEMSVEYLMNREIDEERVLIATEPPLEAFRRGLMSDLSSNLLQKLMGNKGAGNVVGKVAAGAAVGEVLMDTLFGAMPFGVGAVIGGLFKAAALLKDKQDREQADAVKAASIFTDVTSVEKLLEMSVRAITLRHQEAIRRLDTQSANKFGRWVAVTILMYVLSEDVADTPWHFVEGCLYTLDTFGLVDAASPSDEAKVVAEMAAKGKEGKKGKEGIFGRISSSLSKAGDYIKGAFADVFQGAKDGLAGTGQSGKGTLTRLEQLFVKHDEISFKDLLRQNGMKVGNRDGSNVRFYSEPEAVASPSDGGAAITAYTVYKVEVLIGPFLEIAGNRARIQYTAHRPLPPASVAESMHKIPRADGQPPHFIELLQLKNTSSGNRTPIGGAATSGGTADGAAGGATTESRGSKSNALRKSFELFEYGGGGGSGDGRSVDPNLLKSANDTLRRDLDKVKSESAKAKTESAKEIAGLKSEIAEIKAFVRSLARGGTAAAPAGQTDTDSKSKGSRGNPDAAARDRAMSTSETQRRNVRSKTLAARVAVEGNYYYAATYEANGKTKKGKEKKVWLVGEVQGEKNTFKIYEDSKMKGLPLMIYGAQEVNLTKVSLVEEESGKKKAGFIIHQAGKQLTLVSDKPTNVDSLKAFLESAGLDIVAASASGGAKASSKSPSKRFTWRKQKTSAAPKGQADIRVVTQTLEYGASSDFESCKEGDEVTILKSLPDNTFIIETKEGHKLLHGDAFKASDC